MTKSTFENEFRKIAEEFNSPVRLKREKRFFASLADKPVIIFGASFVGDAFYDTLLAKGITVEGFCDNYRTGTTPGGHDPIVDINTLQEEYIHCNVVLSVNKGRKDVYEQLLNKGFKKEQVFADADYLWAQGNLTDFGQYKDGYAWAYDFFGDNVSKSIVLGRIKRFLFGEPLEATSEDKAYFPKGVIALNHNEVFIDGGCYTGDTVEEFISQSKGRYSHIYSFEPDDLNFQKAVKNTKNHQNVTLINKGLWYEDTKLSFHKIEGTGAGSYNNAQAPAKNIITTPVTSIDSFFDDRPKHELPTYIKLDVEGAEFEALRGAEKTILSSHPKLAVCVYHKPEDVYQLPKLIDSLDKSYKQSLVQHENDVHETVLYAV